MAVVPPEQVKAELERLLSEAMSSENVEEVERMYHSIMKTSNDLRSCYNVPERRDYELMTVLKTPTEQLNLAGAGTETLLGAIVHKRACAPGPAVGPTLFDQCFLGGDQATEYREQVRKIVAAQWTEPMVLYPPLLVRASKTSVCLFHVGPDGQVVPNAKPNAGLLLFAEGPILPVVAESCNAVAADVIFLLYRLQGVTDVSTLTTTLRAVRRERKWK